MKKKLVLSLLFVAVSMQAALYHEQEQCAKDLAEAIKNDDLRTALEVIKRCQEVSGQEPAQLQRAMYQASNDDDMDTHKKISDLVHRGVAENLDYKEASWGGQCWKEVKYFHNDHTLLFYSVPVAIAAAVVAGVAILNGLPQDGGSVASGPGDSGGNGGDGGGNE